MKIPIHATLILLALTGVAHAAPESKPVQVITNERLAPDVPFQVKPHNANEEGVEVTFLVEAENLTEFKDDSLTLSALSAGDGVKLPANLAKRIKFSKFHSSVSDDGTYGRFSVKIPLENPMRSAKKLKFAGTLVAYTAGTTVTTPATPLPAENAPAITLGEFKVSQGKAMGGFFGMGAKEGAKTLGVTLTGPLANMKELVVSDGKKTLKSNSRSSSSDTATYGYSDWDGQSPLTVSIVTWKDRPEIRVPFSFGE